MPWEPLFWLLLLAGVSLVLAVVVRALRGGVTDGPAQPRAGAARALLDERYARGEIGTEEYRQRRRALEEEG
jgi:putative membrane protein